MKRYRICIAALLIAAAAGTPVSGQEVIDAVVAVVGDKIILKSEIMQKAQQVAAQQNISVTSPAFAQLKDDMLEELISQKILLIKAKQDTITVEDSQIDADLESRMEAFIEQAGSVENLERTFDAPLREIKKKFRAELKDYMIVQKVQQMKLMDVKIYPQEVEEFYNTMKDSLPEKQEMVKIRHILIGIKAGGEAYQKAMEKMRGIKARLDQGESFEALAKTFSEDPGTAADGGDLGFIERGDIFEEFENAAFRLKDGEISPIVRTDVGLHIIKCIENRGDRVHVAHIFVKILETMEDEQATVALITDLRKQILAGASFDSLAALYSEDATTADIGGDVGWTSVQNMQIPVFADAVDTLEVGEISMPFKTPFGYHIVLKEDEQKQRPFSLAEDYEQLKNAALAQKKNKVFLNWIEDLKKEIHIEIKRDLLE
ncbi:peptidylprolyl isomerase [bacterium]|nr:peptidylprolyl isomerase [bacterium]